MRLALIACLLPLALLAPTVGADSASGATTGMNLGFTSVGAWDIFYYTPSGATTTLGLSWAPSLFPGADYDLRLYRPGALDDGALTDNELIAESSIRTSASHTEQITMPLVAGRYVVAIMPWQTQLEEYTLTASGQLQYATTALGQCTGCY